MSAQIKKIGKLFGFGFIALLLTITLVAATSTTASWTSSGQSNANWRSQPLETTITTNNASKLSAAFTVATGGDVSATPNISNGIAYFPDWAGNLWAVSATTGAKVWEVSLATVTQISGAYSRVTPTSVPGGYLVVPLQNQGWLVEINQRDGSLVWKTQLSNHIAAVLTQSPAVYQGVIYEGVSSQEEFFAASAGYPCCTFRGSLAAVSAATGQILWQTYTVPDNGGQPGGYSGGAVWGSQPVVDPGRNQVYIGTGNNYTVPACSTNNCPLDPADYVDAVLALDMTTGAVKWHDVAMGVPGGDAWSLACIASISQNPSACPSPSGPDFDFGQGPMKINAGGRDLIAIGQKSGTFWALDPATGNIVWSTGVNFFPGSSLGGMEWGSATDGQRIYFADANYYGIPFSYTFSSGNTFSTNSGFWGALDPATGKVLWLTADPNNAVDIGAVSVADGVVFVGSLGNPVGYQPNQTSDPAKTDPTFFALNASNGKILWSFASGGSVASGPAIANGMVYWGTGYGHFNLGTGNPVFYAFKVK